LKYLNNLTSNQININNKKFALIIGYKPSKGARSPKLWNSAYKYFNKNIKMYPADVNEKNLKKLCENLKKDKSFLGSSVAVPYKEIIIKYLDTIDKNAKIIGSVNTIVKTKNKLVGYNTDYDGSLYSIKKSNLNNLKKTILIIGCGGAGKACIVSAVNYFKNSKIILFNRTNKKLSFFLKNLINKNNNNIKQILHYSEIKKYKKIDLIINTTSVGFSNWIKTKKNYFHLENYCSLSKVDFSKVNKKNYETFMNKNILKIKKNIISSFNILSNLKKTIIFDIIYNPNETILIKLSKLLGYKYINGLDMNLIQAVEGFKIVNSTKMSKQKILRAMQNG